MRFQLLEDEPHIKPVYLQYLIEQWHEIIWYNQPVDKSTVDVIVVRARVQVNHNLLQHYPHLRHICRIGVWLDNIDVQLCKDRNIDIHNTPWSNAAAVTELVIWWMIEISRRLKSIAHDWNDRYVHEWHQLNSYQVGIIWFGHIGKRVYQWLLWLWVRQIHIYDPYYHSIGQDEVNATIWHNLEEMVWHCDVLTFHTPLTRDTTNLLDDTLLSQCKSNVMIINTSRWDVINELDLYNFLTDHPRASALLDVRSSEPDYNNTIMLLRSLPNVLHTPHIGALTYQATQQSHYFYYFDHRNRQQ